MCSYFLLGFVGVGLALFFIDIYSRDSHLCLKYLVSIPLSFFPSSLISHEMGLGLILLVIFILILSLFPPPFYFPLFLACNGRWTFFF